MEVDRGEFANRFKEREGPFDVGFDERSCRDNAPIDMGFCGKVDHCVDLTFFKEMFYERLVADISLDKAVAGVFMKTVEIAEICRVAQEVEIDDSSWKRGAEEMADKGRADEAGAASD